MSPSLAKFILPLVPFPPLIVTPGFPSLPLTDIDPPSFPDTETPFSPKVTLVSPFWIDSIFFNAFANWISSLATLSAVASEATTLIFPSAPTNPVDVVPCPAIFKVVPNALCVLPSFPLKSSPAWASACKSAKFTALSNPVVFSNNFLTASCAFSAVTAVFSVRSAPNALAILLNVVAFVVLPSAFTNLNSGFDIPSLPCLGVPFSSRSSGL